MDQHTYKVLDKKRRLYLAACIIAVIAAGADYAWTVMQLPFISKFGGEGARSAVVLCYTIAVLSTTLSPTVFNTLLTRLGPSKTILAGALACAGGYIIGGSMTALPAFYIFFGFMRGAGCGFIYITIMGYITHIFPDKRGAASGAVAGAYGGAAMLWSPLLARIIEGVSIQSACIVIGLVQLAIFIPVSFIVRPMPESYIEYRSENAAAGPDKKNCLQGRSLTRGEMFRTGLFYAAYLAFAGTCSTGLMVMSQTSSIMQQSFLMSAAGASLYASLMSFMSMAGRFFWGPMTDRFDKCRVLLVICALPVPAMLCAAFSGSLAAAAAGFAVTAFCYGGCGGIISAFTAYLFGSEHLTANYSVMNTAFGAASLIAPQLAVRLSVQGDYTLAFLAAALLSAVSSCMALLVIRISQSYR